LYTRPDLWHENEFSRRLIEWCNSKLPPTEATPPLAADCLHTEYFPIKRGEKATELDINRTCDRNIITWVDVKKRGYFLPTPQYHDGRKIECGVGEIEAEELEGGCCYAVVEEMVDKIVMDPDEALRKRVTNSVARDCFEVGMTRVQLAQCILDALNEAYAEG
jgi:hypothetical protein